MFVSGTNGSTIFVFQLNIIKGNSKWPDRKTSELSHVIVIDLSTINTLVEIQITCLRRFIAIFLNNRRHFSFVLKHILGIVLCIFCLDNNLKECIKHFRRFNALFEFLQICHHLFVEKISTISIMIPHHNNIVGTRINIFCTSSKSCGA